MKEKTFEAFIAATLMLLSLTIFMLTYMALDYLSVQETEMENMKIYVLYEWTGSPKLIASSADEGLLLRMMEKLDETSDGVYDVSPVEFIEASQEVVPGER